MKYKIITTVLVFILLTSWVLWIIDINQTKEIPMNELYKYLEGEEIIEQGKITRFIDKRYNKLIYVNKEGFFQVVDFEEKYYLEENTLEELNVE
jgi:hypothetical protein